MHVSTQGIAAYNYAVLFLAILITGTLKAQTDSSRFRLDVVPIFGFDRLVKNQTNSSIHAPQYLVEKRNENYGLLYPNYDAGRYIDFPQTHWSFFGGVSMNFEFDEKIGLNAMFIGENQSSSAGVLGFNHFAVFPRLTLYYHEKFTVKKHRLSLRAYLGDMVDFRTRAGLLVYNIDVQGGEVALGFDDFYVAYTSIGDMSLNIGLNIHEWAAWRVGYFKEASASQVGIDAGVAVDINQYIDDYYFSKHNLIPSLYTLIDFKSGVQLYGELSYRNLQGPLAYDRVNFSPPAGTYNVNDADRIATVLGITDKLKVAKKHSLGYRAEVRYYGKAYTKYFFEYKLPYREGYGQRGKYLYPLMNAYRPFNQFAVFSEFQDMSVVGVNVQLKTLWTIYDRLKYRANLETLIIHTFENQNFTRPFPYLFYETGLVFQITPDIEASVFFSNKVMNLDLSYQTFYQSQIPLFGYAVRSSIPLQNDQRRQNQSL